MLQVKLDEGTGDLEVRFRYNKDYINRMRDIPGTSFVTSPDGSDKYWSVPSLMIEAFDSAFSGEIMYMTPKWVITGEAPPDYNSIYSQVSNISPTLKEPYKPYPFQSFGANFLATMATKYGWSCLLDDMGTGKTLMSITGNLILNEMDADIQQMDIPTLVVCKSSLKYQWISDGVDKFTHSNSVVIDGTKKKRKMLYDQIAKKPGAIEYVIVGYETVREDIDIITKLTVGVAIFDEAHKIRNKETRVNKATRQINSKYNFFLTGSPISKDPSEMFGIGLVGNPKYFGTWKQFQKDYVTVVKTAYGVDYFYRNLHDLKVKIDNVALRRTEKEIDLQMPKIVQQNVRLNMTKVQMDIDAELLRKQEEYVAELISLEGANMTPFNVQKKEKIEGAMKGLIALRMGCADTPELFTMSRSASIVKEYGAIAKKDLTSPKLLQLIEQVTEVVSSGHKIVVFTKFETMTRIIERELSKITGVVLFTGKMNAREKEDARLKFRNTDTHNVFVATNAGAEGLNLQCAKYLVNFDLDWDIGINDQRNKRIRRLDSQFDRVFVYNYICNDSADEMVLKSLVNNQILFDYLIENNYEQSNQMKLAMANY